MGGLALGPNEGRHLPAGLHQLLVHAGHELVHQAHRLDDVSPEELESVESLCLPSHFVAHGPLTCRP